MPVDRKRKIIFVHIPKTGGTSIETGLGICGIDNLGSNEVSLDLLFGFNGTCFLQHLTAKEICQLVSKQEYKFISFVRNPYERILSAYLEGDDTIKLRRWFPKLGFKYFVLPKLLINSINYDPHRHFRRQSDFLDSEFIRNDLFFIGKFESIQSDFEDMCVNLEIDAHLPHRNKSKKKLNKQGFYDKHTQQKVLELYKEDFVLFNYSANLPCNLK